MTARVAELIANPGSPCPAHWTLSPLCRDRPFPSPSAPGSYAVVIEAALDRLGIASVMRRGTRPSGSPSVSPTPAPTCRRRRSSGSTRPAASQSRTRSTAPSRPRRRACGWSPCPSRRRSTRPDGDSVTRSPHAAAFDEGLIRSLERAPAGPLWRTGPRRTSNLRRMFRDRPRQPVSARRNFLRIPAGSADTPITRGIPWAGGTGRRWHRTGGRPVGRHRPGPIARSKAVPARPRPSRAARAAPTGQRRRQLGAGSVPRGRRLPEQRSAGLRLGVLASGSGTILEAILAADLPVDWWSPTGGAGRSRWPTAGIVPRPRRPLRLRRASAPRSTATRYTEAVTDALAAAGSTSWRWPDSARSSARPVHDAYPGRILNTHPALLPAFPGWHAVRDALAAGAAETGTTVHVATLEMDTGPSWPRPVPVLADDTEDTLHERIKAVERTLYPATIRSFIDGLATRRSAMGTGSPRRYTDEGIAVRLRQDRDRRAGPGALRPGMGARLERRHLGRARRRGDRPHRGGRPDRRTRDARRPGQDAPPGHPRRDPGRPVQARAPGGPRAPGHRPDRPGGLQPLPVLLRPLRRAHRRRWADHGAGRGQEPRPRRRGRRPRRLRPRSSTSCGRTGRCPSRPVADWPGRPSPTPPATTPPSSSGSTNGSRRPSTLAPPSPSRRPPCSPDHPPGPRAGRGRCATGRTPTSRVPATGSSASTRGGTRSSSTAARSSPTSTSSTPTRRGGSSTNSRPTGRTVAVAIIKHANPCGAAVAADLVVAYRAGTRVRSPVGLRGHRGRRRPGRRRRWPRPSPPGPRPTSSSPRPTTTRRWPGCRRNARPPACCPRPPPSRWCGRSVGSGASVLVQDADRFVVDPVSWEVATKVSPTEDQWRDLALAWMVCARTTSNAIAVVERRPGGRSGRRAAVPGGRGRDRRVEGRRPGSGRGGGERRLLPLPRRPRSCWPRPG